MAGRKNRIRGLEGRRWSPATSFSEAGPYLPLAFASGFFSSSAMLPGRGADRGHENRAEDESSDGFIGSEMLPEGAYGAPRLY